MPDEFEALCRGRILALELALRDLYANWAVHHDDPVAFIEDRRRGMIASMNSIQTPKNVYEERVWQGAEGQIDDLFDNVVKRVTGATKRQGAYKS